MTNRYFAIDIRDALITLLQNSFNTTITTINSERTHTTPPALSIGYDWGQNQYQLLRVEVKDSEVQYNEAALNLNLQHLPEVYNVNVAGFIKSNDSNMRNWVEDWIEAIIRTLHNYSSPEISWCAYTGSNRTELYNERNETAKIIEVNFEVRVK